MKDSNDMQQIVATLKYGKVLGKKYLIFFWCMLIFILVCSAIVIVTELVVNLTDIVEKKIPTDEFVAIIISMIVLDGVMGGLFGYIFSRDRKTKREIREWLADAVKLKAYCEEISERLFVPLIHNVSCIGDVQVTFRYKSDKKVLRSNLSNSRNGTGKVFTKFVGKEIYIMYSPKYKQVMFVDEPCEQSPSLEIM